MSYSTEITALLAEQLAKFVTLNRHQLAGQVANLDFWMAEAAHALAVIDGYGARFQRLKAAQQRYVDAHGTTEFDPRCRYPTPRPAAAPTRVPGDDLRDARRALCEAVYRFLLRCHHERLLDPAALRAACDRLGIGVEASDLRPPP